MDERVKLTYISFFNGNYIARDDCFEFFIEPKALLDDLLGGKSWFFNMKVVDSGSQG